jgi:hypothetical protein
MSSKASSPQEKRIAVAGDPLIRRYTPAMRNWVVVLAFLLFSTALLAESAAGLRWSAPAGWKSEGGRTMRAATYTMTPAAGDRDTAECGVYFFGVGQGGSVQANIDRWKAQFQGPDGKTAPAQVAKKTVHGLTITTIDSSGEYSGMGGPMASGRAVPGYRLLGGIVEGPGGNIFVKFTGPARTIAANQQKFERLLASFEPATQERK